MRISISHDFPAVQRQLERLSRDVADTVRARALNRTVEIARTRMVARIRDEFMVTAKFVRDRLVIRKAFARGALRMEATLAASSERRRAANVIAFGAKQRATGVSVRIKRAGGRRTIVGAFIANKGRTVFRRVPGTTMPSRAKYKGTKHAHQIAPVMTIEVSQMFNTRRINASVLATIRERFPEVFARELRFALSQRR